MFNSNKYRLGLTKWQKAILVTAVGTFILKHLSRSYPSFIEEYYTNGLYNIVRVLFDGLLGWISFPIIYILLLVLVIVIAFRFKVWKKDKSVTSRSIRFIYEVGTLLAIVYISFTWLWGFNYEKLRFEKKFSLQSVTPSDSLLFEDLKIIGNNLSDIRLRMGLPDSMTLDMLPVDLNDLVRTALTEGFKEMGFESKGDINAKKVLPKGILLRISTAGVFLPFTGEGHIDAGLHALQMPFVMAHEMSHVQGFTDEGVCNFLSYYALTRSDSPILIYSGLVGYFRYLASQCRRIDRDAYRAVITSLNEKVQQDIADIDKNNRKYPDILPKLRDFTYDRYLKSQGIREGIRSYHKVISLNYAWQNKYGPIYFFENDSQIQTLE